MLDRDAQERQVEFRIELTHRAKEVLGQNALDVIEYGSSCTKPKRDLYSDVDLWTVVPDRVAEEVIENRDDIYHEIGGPHVKYERPRFAPIDGMHSIVMFRGPEVHQEVDITLVPERHHHLYESFLTDRPGDPCDQYPWREGDESCDPADKLSYLLCVSLWTMKYSLRGDDSRLEWMLKRFEEVRNFVPELGEPDETWRRTDDVASVVQEVVSRVDSVVSEDGVMPNEKLRHFKAVPSLGVTAVVGARV